METEFAAAGRRQWPALGFTVLGLIGLIVLLAAPVASVAAECPNEAVRAQQRSTSLATCRAYEMVSPVDKDGGDIGFTQGQLQASASGEALVYASTRAFADAVSSPKFVKYIARRSGTGWQTKSLSPPLDPSALAIIFFPEYRMFSEDLSHGVLRASEPLLAPGAPDEVNSLYARNTQVDSYSLLTPSAPDGDPLYQPFFAAASADFSHVTFESTGSLTPDAPADGVTKLYEYADGQVRLAGIVGGEAAAGGSVAGTGAGFFTQYSQRKTQQTMSDDGSRIFFTAAPDFEGNGQIYLRENGVTTTHVSASQRTVPDPNGTKPARFEGASDDGAFAFFSTTEQLLDEDTNEARDLYRYGVDDGNLRLLSKDHESGEWTAGLAGVIEVSHGGDYVYFAATGQLIAGGPTGPGTPIYLWRASDGALVEVAKVNGTSYERDTLWSGNYLYGDEARISADGKLLAFAGSAPSGGPRQIYLFNADTQATVCISCAASPPAGDSTLSPQTGGVLGNFLEYEGRAISSDKSTVFFTTPNALLLRDSNGRNDVYAYSVGSGALSLVSTGESGDDSWFIDASSSGDSIFFATRQQLVVADRDPNVDAYVARVGGGFPEPSLSPLGCVGEACQAPATQPPASIPSSSSFAGPGNTSSKEAMKHKRGKRRHHGHRRKRCGLHKQKRNQCKRHGAKKKGMGSKKHITRRAGITMATNVPMQKKGGRR